MTSLESIASHAGTFLAGVLLGACGTYLADKYTDRRREQEAAAARDRQFQEAFNRSRRLCEQMRSDVNTAELSMIRSFYVLRSRRLVFNAPSERYLAYYEDEHEQLRDQIALLEDDGAVTLVRDGNCPQYRFAEDFVAWLRSS